MSTRLHEPALDRFRLMAVLMVVCIHTSPLDSITPLGDFVLTRVFCRVAVPFFLMVSGHFLAAGQWRSLGRFWRKTLLLYGLSIALYLPLNWYTGSPSGWGWIKALLTDGTFYHLWYFPALLLGVPLARLLARMGMPAALTLAGPHSGTVLRRAVFPQLLHQKRPVFCSSLCTAGGGGCASEPPGRRDRLPALYGRHDGGGIAAP